MSDRGDYKEPKAGDWMVIVDPYDGDVDCRKVDRVEGDPKIATLDDGSKWGAETGQPINRRWAGKSLWQVDPVYLPGEIAGLIGGASPEAMGEVYAILLADKRARRQRVCASPTTANRTLADLRHGDVLSVEELWEMRARECHAATESPRPPEAAPSEPPGTARP